MSTQLSASKSGESAKNVMSELDGQFETTVAMHDEKHIQVGEYLKSFIYGGLDGTVNTLTIIAGGVAATQQPTKIMKIGLSAMIGDGLGMGLSDYLSAKAEKQFILSEEKRELWEVNNRLEDEKSEVVCIYEANNYT